MNLSESIIDLCDTYSHCLWLTCGSKTRMQLSTLRLSRWVKSARSRYYNWNLLTTQLFGRIWDGPGGNRACGEEYVAEMARSKRSRENGLRGSVDLLNDVPDVPTLGGLRAGRQQKGVAWF